MITVTCLVVLGLGYAPPATASHRTQAAELATAGWQLWQQHKFAPAEEKFAEAVQLDPKNANAWNGLGWSQFNQGRTPQAVDSFDQVIKLVPKHPAALNGLGQAALLQRDYDKAEGYLLKAAPQASAAWYGLVRLYLLTGKFDQAEKWLKRIGADNNDPSLAAMQQAIRDRQLSPELRQVLEPPAHAGELAQGWQLMNQGRHDDARLLFEELLKSNPQDASALNAMGWCLLNTGAVDEAKVYFERALDKDPTAAGSMNGLARVLYAGEDVEGAVRIWRDMVDKIPGVHAGTSNLAEVYMQREEFDLALPLLEQLTTAMPDNTQYAEMLQRAKSNGTP